MPKQKTTKRNLVGFRLSERGIAWIEELRDEFDVTTSEVYRAALAVAVKHTPEVKAMLRSRV